MRARAQISSRSALGAPLSPAAAITSLPTLIGTPLRQRIRLLAAQIDGVRSRPVVSQTPFGQAVGIHHHDAHTETVGTAFLNHGLDNRLGNIGRERFLRDELLRGAAKAAMKRVCNIVKPSAKMCS